MNQIDSKKWATFSIDDIFDIRSGKRLTKSDMTDGNIPFVGASDSHNGITAFISNSNDSYDSNVLGVNYNGSVCETFYHPYHCMFSDDVKRLSLKSGNNNKYTLLFLKQSIIAQKSKYQYGYKFNERRMKKQLILLPILNNGSPDWQFMEDYMKQQEYKLLQKIHKRLAGKVVSSLITRGSLSECKWKEFYFTEVFDEIQRGKRLTKAQQIEGDMPYISSTAMNNGVDGFIGNTERVRIFENCITLANSGSVGNAFFQSYRFVASDHVTKLKATNLDKYAYLFMLPIINRLAEKYSFNREINDERIKREKLLLPVTESDDIDFEFMSSFAKRLEAESVKNIIDIYSQRIDNHVVKWGG